MPVPTLPGLFENVGTFGSDLSGLYGSTVVGYRHQGSPQADRLISWFGHTIRRVPRRAITDATRRLLCCYNLGA
jgi:hypothetical protein